MEKSTPQVRLLPGAPIVSSHNCMTRTDRIWKHTDEAFNHANRAFKSADEAFAEAERLFHSLPNGNRSLIEHNLRFQSRNWRERWRLTCKFFKLGWDALFTGKAEFHFKERK